MAGWTEGLVSRLSAILPAEALSSTWHVLLLLVMLLAPLLLLLWILRNSGSAGKVSALPGPKPVLPIIGSAHLIPSDMTDMLTTIAGFARQYPGLFYLRLWEEYVIINSPEAAEAILGSNEHITKGEEYLGLLPWLGDGLLVSRGAKWRKRRKMLTPAFHFNILDKFMDVFNEQSLVLVNKLRETNAEKVDIFPFITKATLDIICETAMGVKIHAQDGARSDYVAAVYDMGYVSFLRFIQPWLKFDFIFRLTSHYRTQVRSLKLLHGFTNSVIHERREELKDKSNEDATESAGKKRLAFLDLLLASTIDGQPLSDSDIREEVDTFMFEGHDTTSSGINWTLYNLGSHPEVQAKTYAEVSEVLGDDISAPISRDQLSKLSYLEMVIKESMRLFPPVPMIGRRLASDANIGGYHVPGHFMIGILIYSIHRDPTHWPDPERFDPERFSVESSRGRHPYAYVPFSAGPRNCIGQKFALMEEKVVIANVLRAFEIKAFDKREDLRVRGDVILRLDGGLWLSFTPRVETLSTNLRA